MKIAHALVIATVCLTASPLLAQDNNGSLRDACKGDVATYCKDVPMGEGRIIRCLRDHKDMLTPACKTALRGLFERRKGDK